MEKKLKQQCKPQKKWLASSLPNQENQASLNTVAKQIYAR
jgi:hypothetical protein